MIPAGDGPTGTGPGAPRPWWRRARREKPPPPLDATLLRHPLRWTRNKLLLAIDGLVLVHVGTLIVVALYYLAFQTIPGVKYDWDHALTGQLHFWNQHVHIAVWSAAHWAQWRHLIRNVAEGLLGGILGQAVIWNHYRVRPKPRTRIDDIEIALHIPNLKDGRRTSVWQMLTLPSLVLIYAIPGFLIGAGVAHLLQHGVAHLHVHQLSSDSVVRSLWTSNVDQKVIGLFASFVFGRRIGRGVYDDVQQFFAERRYESGKPLVFYHRLLPTFVARYNGVAAAGGPAEGTVRHGRVAGWILVGSVPVAIALAGFGYYVLAYIATGKG